MKTKTPKTLQFELHRCDDLMLYFVVYDGISADEASSGMFRALRLFSVRLFRKSLKLKLCETSQKDCVDITVALFIFLAPATIFTVF